jgi:NCAIR mutase (PurE)-related protein
MDEKKIRDILENIKNDKINIEKAIQIFKNLPYEDIGYAKVDHHRALRNGYPEVIYCEGKTNEQIRGILTRMIANGSYNILATRASREVYEAVSDVCEDVEYYEIARIVSVNKKNINKTKGIILVITGGTSDMPIAEEAAVTAEVMGNAVERLYDVGVAGIHRLLSYKELIMKANVIITVAGMEGALASVVGGLVDKPVIAVPTSVGYGANFGGLSALLGMLNSCASGVAVVNIDNGFGAGYLAGMINRLGER